MAPHRLIHNRKGYLTETVFDECSGRFVERAWPPPVPAEGSGPMGEVAAECDRTIKAEYRSC